MYMKKIVFMGTPDFSVPILQNLVQSEYEVVLVVTQPDRPKGRKKILTAPPIKVEAEKQQIPVFQPEKLTDAYEEIIAYEPDLIVTARSEEHTSELQSRGHLVCRLLLEKKKNSRNTYR